MDRSTKAVAISDIKGRFDKMSSAVFLDFKADALIAAILLILINWLP